MKNILMNFADKKESRIMIKEGLIDDLGRYLKSFCVNKDVFVITNPVVKLLHGKKLISGFSRYGIHLKFIEIPDGEKYKSLSTASDIYDSLLKEKADRATVLMSFGGGVIGDLTGFIASTYMRGIPLIHIPTTLLAQVDSSIGGKVAVDHSMAKNIVGSFYQANAVYTDPEVLQTLSDKHIKDGITEVIKIAVIKSPAFFKWLEKNINQLLKKHKNQLYKLVKEAISLKVDIVLKDPWESGLRKILNYGHSIGHALEVKAGYQDISHGEAVALGMLTETKIAYNKGMCSKELEAKIRKILLSLRMRKSILELIKDIDYDQLWETLTLDKKNYQGKMAFILPEALGKVSLFDNITKKEVIKALEELKKEGILC